MEDGEPVRRSRPHSIVYGLKDVTNDERDVKEEVRERIADCAGAQLSADVAGTDREGGTLPPKSCRHNESENPGKKKGQW